MSVSPISSASVSPAQSANSSNWQNVLSAVSSTLGLNTSSLQQQLQSGQSLSTIAQSQGVSQQSLIQSISTALTQSGSQANATQLTQIATSIAQRTPGAGGHHGGHHHHGGAGSSTDQSSEDTLLSALSPTSTSDSDALTTNTDSSTQDTLDLLA